MSDQNESPAASAVSQKTNEDVVSSRTRIPMSVPQPRLAVPDLPGYFLYWFLGKNTARARQAGYEFVEDTEIEMAHKGISSDREGADLGSRVSTPAGQDAFDSQGQPERLYLMKLRQEWREEDIKAKSVKSEETLAALRVGALASTGDTSNRYTGEQNRNIFRPQKRSA